MGFKDLTLFNDALLAKQAWQLLHNKDSLFYRMFKSKFFPHCSILDDKENFGGSYAWRSILKGRYVLKKVFVGGLEQGKVLICGQIHGCHPLKIQGFNLLCHNLLLKLMLLILLIL